MKGLGELDEDETDILTNPNVRIIKQVTVSDIKKADRLFEELMGQAVIPRKEYIKNHSEEATYNAE